jgi:multidrug efflux pump subunit AcrB
MILPEHEKYHKMNAKEADIREKTIMHVSKTTSMGGEQLHAEIPIYPDDTREQITDRMNFMFSLLQERLETENKAIENKNQAQQRIHDISMAIKRNHLSFQTKSRALQKNLSKKKISQANYDQEMIDLKAKLDEANRQLEEGLGGLTPNAERIIEKAAEEA